MTRAPRPFVRIIGGRWRGRRLPAPLSAPFRPSGDRIRESLFNCLGQRLDGKSCLDLFAGTGALGLEAASRGAAKVVFVERDRESLRRTLKAAEELAQVGGGGGDSEVEFGAAEADIFAWLESGGPDGTGGEENFDLIFADPPFADYREDSAWARLLDALGPRLASGGLVYCESDRFFRLPAGWREETARRAGRARWRILGRAEGVEGVEGE